MRKHRVARTLCAILATMMSTVVNAEAQTPGLSDVQRETQERQISLLFGGVTPQGDFKQNVSSPTFGADFQFLVPIGHSPIFVGADFGGSVYGSETRHVPFSSTIPDVTVGVQTDNYIVLGNLVLRAQPRTGRFRPFVDALVGFNYLSTDTTIDLGRSSSCGLFEALFGCPNTENTVSTTNLDDTTFSHGFGAGAQVDLGHRHDYWLSLDVRVRDLRGGHADYLKKGSIRRTDGVASFDVLSSRTDVITAQAGLTFHF